MSSSKKLFIAAMLVAAGYGAASLLGGPDPRSWPVSWAPLGAGPHGGTTAASGAADLPAGQNMVGSVRLLPESATRSANRPIGGDAGYVDIPEASAPPELTVAAVAAETPATSSMAPGSQRLMGRPAPRATLKNEAPRAMPTSNQQAMPAAMNQVAPIAFERTAAALQQAANNKVLSAGFTSDASTVGTMNAVPIAAAFQPLVVASPLPLASPPPWPMVEPEPSRSHVIVDGDSLARLAGRYLDDPRRSEEIFTLNRGVLSDQELLPIGVELKIPPRGSVGKSQSPWSQSQMVGTSTIHAAEHAGLVPVRSLPPRSNVLPRAQLLPPRPVE